MDVKSNKRSSTNLPGTSPSGSRITPVPPPSVRGEAEDLVNQRRLTVLEEITHSVLWQVLHTLSPRPSSTWISMRSRAHWTASSC
jgi:hypothetical protein